MVAEKIVAAGLRQIEEALRPERRRVDDLRHALQPAHALGAHAFGIACGGRAQGRDDMRPRGVQRVGEPEPGERARARHQDLHARPRIISVP